MRTLTPPYSMRVHVTGMEGRACLWPHTIIIQPNVVAAEDGQDLKGREERDSEADKKAKDGLDSKAANKPKVVAADKRDDLKGRIPSATEADIDHDLKGDKMVNVNRATMQKRAWTPMHTRKEMSLWQTKCTT